jgi:hypothetical protein
MLKSSTIPTCLALGLAIVASSADAQVVRESVRRTGEAAVQGSRAISQGTRNAINRTGQATRNVIDGTTEAARAPVDRLQRSELQRGDTVELNSGINAGAQAGPGQIQANAGIDTNQQLDSSVQSPPGDPNNPSLQGEYQSGYRGVNDQGISVGQANGQANYNGRVYRLRHDRNGREFICVSGRAVYFDNQQGSQPQQHEAYKLNDRQMNYQQQQGEMEYQSRQYPSDMQSGNLAPQGAPPAPPTPIHSELNSSIPASPSLNADTSISAEQRTGLNESADVDANTNADASAHTNTDGSNDTSVDTNLEANADSSDTNIDASADANADVDSSNDQSSNDNDASNN